MAYQNAELNDIQAEALAHLRRESLDLYNRLHSIEEDIAFVKRVREAYPSQVLLPNLRCGEWYTDPNESCKEAAYFKSTDGHYRNWSFNLRRPNLHLISVALNNNGLLLVDSTRAGKRIPDALSKTVPIWCSVINRASTLRFPELHDESWNAKLYTPPGVVSAQEHKQIEEKLDQWARDLANSSYDIPHLPCPLRPLWITPATSTFPSVSSAVDGKRPFLPIICVSASKQVHDGVERRSHGFSYVQGSGDDHELWGMGLTPKLFWENRRQLLQTDRDSLPNLVADLVARSRQTLPRQNSWASPPTPIPKIRGRILISRLSDLPSIIPDADLSSNMAFILVSPSMDDEPSFDSTEPAADEPAPKMVLRMTLPPGKKSQYKFLKGILPKAMNFIGLQLKQGNRICIACESGKDTSVGVALVALQMFFDESGQCLLDSDGSAKAVSASKESIRTRLQWIISSRPEANPSRTTLKRINDFLLSPSSL